ncbi:MAG: HAMP domain-containing histidine kinase [Bradymonadales bacterium]|nr:HAMP domain-containing histidine kinase [Bradymonadales bacterium]
MRFRLRTKLAIAFLLPVLALFLGAGMLVHRVLRRGLEEELGVRLSSIAQSISVSFTTTRDVERLSRLLPDPESLVRQRFVERLNRFRDTIGVRRIFAVTPGLESLLDTRLEVMPGTPLYDLEADRSEIRRLVEGEAGSVHSVLFTGADGTRYMHGYAPVHLEGELVAIFGVEGSAGHYAALDALGKALVVLGLLVVMLVVAVAVFFSHRLTRPMTRLVDAIRRYGRGDLKEPVEVTTRDEVGFLTEAFNEMRASLDRRDEQMQLMLSGIAHEVRNPLAGMELFCSLLKEELESDPVRLEYVEKINRELDYLARVVTDFLNYARRRPLTPERFAAQPLVDQLVEGLRGEAARKGVVLKEEVETGLELTGEREALRGTCANIVQNAVQASKEGGVVEIRAWGVGSTRYLEVSDNGHGIPEGKIKQIFEPFFTTRQQGTGLGLALAHKTVQGHGGEIEVESVVGQGTRLRIKLPFDESLRPLVHEPEYERSQTEVEMIG